VKSLHDSFTFFRLYFYLAMLFSLLLLVPIASAHFLIAYPGTRGFDESTQEIGHVVVSMRSLRIDPSFR
jgi:hypothetical protein